MPQRQQSPSTIFRRPPVKQGRVQRWRTATLNWLNGLPVRTEEDFDSSSIKNELQASRARRKTTESIKYYVQPRNWFRSKSTENVALGAENPPETVVEPNPEDKRLPVRIIQLPPELNPISANKQDDLHSALVTNEIRTAKYTALTFLPKNLLEQMRRVANIYFVIIVILQCFPAVSNYNPVLAALPIVAIMAVTAIKDAVEDWRRHQQDNEVNYAVASTLNRPEKEQLIIVRDTRWQRLCNWMTRWRDWCLRLIMVSYLKAKRKPIELQGKHRNLAKLPKGAVDWKETFWRDMRVGDIILLRNNDMIPADIMILSTSEPDGVCFVETKNLDGETNLKIRRSPYETEWIQRPEDAYYLKATVEVDLPNNNLYAFNGKIIIAKDLGEEDECEKEVLKGEPMMEEISPEGLECAGVESTDNLINKKSAAMWSGSAFVEPTVIPVGNDGLILRGCIVRNTEFVIGVVVYTGAHTKIMLNSGGTPSKRTRIERQMNPQIILNFVLLFVICVACAVVQSQFSSASADGNAPYWVSAFDKGLLTSSAFLGFLTFWSSLILFQTLVPISMYVTVEMVKTIQVFHLIKSVSSNHGRHSLSIMTLICTIWNLTDELYLVLGTWPTI
jgi:phospholipid-translocating ATPase